LAHESSDLFIPTQPFHKKLILETINERVFFYRRKQMSKENISINSDSRVMNPRSHESRWLPSVPALSMIAVFLVAVALGSGYAGVKLGVRAVLDEDCCQIPRHRSPIVIAKEKLGLVEWHSQMGQDKWVSEAVFPGVKNGFFLDVGSGDGTFISNTKTLEQKGWTGICVDAFPRNMQDRTCQIFKAVVFSEAGKVVKFWAAEDWGGIVDETYGHPKWKVDKYPEYSVVEFTTVTLGDILERANAPHFINYMSLD